MHGLKHTNTNIHYHTYTDNVIDKLAKRNASVQFTAHLI